MIRHERLIIQLYIVDWIVSALEWLDDWPVGLKLNTPLSQFFRVGFTTVIEWWGGKSMLAITSAGANAQLWSSRSCWPTYRYRSGVYR